MTQAVKKIVQQLVVSNDATVLILGAGKIGKDLCHKLSKLGYTVWVSTRTEEKSLALVEEIKVKSLGLNKVDQVLNQVQLVISAISVDEPFLTKRSIHLANINNPIYFIDLSVPRSISPELGKHPKCTLFNMEDVNDEISSTLQKRKNEVPKVEAIIKNELSQFLEWTKEMELLPTIHQMKTTLEKIRQEEITRHLNGVESKEKTLVDDITKSIVKRVVKLPALKLKLACKRGEGSRMIQVLDEIFNIKDSSDNN